MEQIDFLYWTTRHPELYRINSPVRTLCGYWTNGAFSPDLYIFKKDKGYWMAVLYPSGEFYTSRIVQVFKSTVVNLCEQVRIGYDIESDILFLSGEGYFHRKKEWEDFSYDFLMKSYKQISYRHGCSELEYNP